MEIFHEIGSEFALEMGAGEKLPRVGAPRSPDFTTGPAMEFQRD